MINNDDLRPISPKETSASLSSEHVSTGVPVPKTIRVSIFSPNEWEEFTEEWANSLKDSYYRVARFSGAGDKGIDVVGFATDKEFEGEWDNYQCKHYYRPLYPSDIWIEVGKVIYYSFKDEYTVPRKYYFVASKDVGTTLQKLLTSPTKFKDEARAKWDEHCKAGITSTALIDLEGDLLDWFNNFNFSIFSSKSVVELIEGHAKTPFHAVRFGGGLPPRPEVEVPPEEHDPRESRYIQQLYVAYGSHLGACVKGVDDSASCPKPKLKEDFLRQRERFYHAESLRNFARDTVPEGTFENLQEEIYQGVVDTCESDHEDGLIRLRATLAQAAAVSTTSNPLKSAVRVPDQQGICHQLANEDRLMWVSEGSGEVPDGSAV